MPVPLLDLTRQYAAIGGEIEAAALAVLRSCRYILGPEVEGFEKDLQAYLPAKHVVAISSGTDALLVALMALGIGPGDAVALPVYSFFATAGVVARVGARPVFVDVEPEFLTMDPRGLEKAFEQHANLRAVITVHLYGACGAAPEIAAICKRHAVPLIEDAAQAIGTRSDGRPAGSFGLCAAWSTFPSKNLGGPGDGGFFSTDDDALAHKVRQLRNHGQSELYRHESIGGNFRLDALQCACLRVKLRHLEQFTTARRQNAARYRALCSEHGLAAKVQLPKDVADRHTYHQYVVHVDAAVRDRVRDQLGAQQIGCAVYYPLPFHLQPCFRHLGHTQGQFPVAEQASRRNLALPIFPELRPDEQQAVVQALAAALAS